MSLLSGMKIYTVHVKEDAVRAAEKPVFLREGFNFYAFIFTGFWAIYHRLWIPLFGIAVCNIALVELSKAHLLNAITLGVLQLTLNVVIGFHANDWRRSKLNKKGYLFADITTGDNLLRAERRYFERYLSAA